MKPLSPAIFLAPLLALLLGAASYWAGDHNRNNAWLAKQAEVERKATQAYKAEVVRGQKAAQDFTTARQALQLNYETLEGKFNELRAHGPVVVYRNRAGVVATADATGAAHTASADLPPLQPAALAGSDHAGDLSVSRAGVWMWNSALIGTDVPAGACGAADTSDAACLADAQVSIEDAWINHIANAKSCALDRQRHQKLIDYLTQGPSYEH